MIGFEFLDGGKIIKKHFDYSAVDLTIPPKAAEHIQINGQECDLRDPSLVKLFSAKINDYYKQLHNGTLKTYDGKSTEMWQGGRSELLKDKIRLQLAEDGFRGKHNLDFKAQKIEADRIASIRAAQVKVEGI